VSLRIENGPQADVITRLPNAKGRWLVVALTDAGFKLYISSTEALSGKRRAEIPEGAEISEVPLHQGQPDWERLTNLMRAVVAKQGSVAGASVAAPAAGRADTAIEALQQLRFALPDAPRRSLITW
jgi:hypothetical protein